MFFFFFFNQHLKTLRDSKNLTQKEVADMLDISERQYRRYEAGDIDIPTSTLIKLADYYNVSLDYITERPNPFYKYTAEDIDKMSIMEFEVFIAQLFIFLGYTYVNQYAAFDLEVMVNDVLYGIEIKHLPEPIETWLIERLISNNGTDMRIEKVMMITNNYYTPAARKLGEDNGVILWDRDTLIQKLEMIKALNTI